MGTKKWSTIRDGKLSPEKVAEIQKEVKAELLEMDQRDPQDEPGSVQAQVARFGDRTVKLGSG